MLPLRSSAFMSFDAPALSFSELIPFERSPFILLSWADFSPFGAMSLDWAAFGAPAGSLDWAAFGASAGAPLCDESRFIGVAAEPRSDAGALRSVVAAPDDWASPLAVPC